MCDYSLHNVKSRPAKVGDKLKTHYFNLGTRGFAAPEDANTAVCVLPGTELAFAQTVRCSPRGSFGEKTKVVNHTTAIFRQINKDNPHTHHDASFHCNLNRTGEQSFRGSLTGFGSFAHCDFARRLNSAGLKQE